MTGSFDPGAELGPRLRQVREQRGLSVRELARRTQCSPSLISQIERGLSAPSVGMLYALATELRTSLDFLFNATAPADGLTITAHGDEVPPAMGTATAINFQPTGGGRAAISGDFVMTAAEVNPVIRALRAGGIRVTALHSHMLDETPRLFFMHFWANDDAAKLAGALRSALDRMHVKK